MAQIEPDLAPDDSVWNDVWNPNPNIWAPSNNPSPAYGEDSDQIGYEDHSDMLTADPMTEQYGRYEGMGSVPDTRENLLDDVHGPTGVAPPTQVVRHEIVTSEAGGELVRGRTVAVVGNVVPTRLLEENPNRKRALIKIVTSTSVILIGPSFGAMGSPELTAIPVQPVGAWLQATGDPVLEIKAQAAVDALGVVAGATVLVSIWEEMNTPGLPGVGQ